VFHLVGQLLIRQENVCVAYYFVNELTPIVVIAGGNLGRNTIVSMYVCLKRGMIYDLI